jgi:AcrR family transcriptional regulator
MVRPVARQSGSETAQRILSVALARFQVDGYRGTSVRDLADDVGVTQPALYYHFGSKDGILVAIVQPLIVAGEELLGELSGMTLARSAMARRALAGYYDLIVDHLDVFQFVETDRSVRSHPDAGHPLADQAARFIELIAPRPTRPGRIRAAAAMGAVRRPLRLPGIDPYKDRELILACATAALHVEGDGDSDVTPGGQHGGRRDGGSVDA